MRRMLAALLITITTLSATLTLTAALLTQTLGDPTRPGRVLAALLESPDGRDVVADLAARASGTSGPQQEQVRAAARRALEDERVRAQTAALTTPRAERGTSPAASAPRAPALEDAIRAQLAAQNPELAQRLSGVPLPLAIPRVSAGPFGELRTLLDSLLPTALRVTLAGALAALLISPARPSVLRRFSRWALGASLVQVVVCVVLPRFVLPEAGSSYLRALGVVITAATERVVPLLLLTLAVGVGCWFAARLLEAARSTDRRTPQNPALPPRDAPRRRGRTARPPLTEESPSASHVPPLAAPPSAESPAPTRALPRPTQAEFAPHAEFTRDAGPASEAPALEGPAPMSRWMSRVEHLAPASIPAPDPVARDLRSPGR